MQVTGLLVLLLLTTWRSFQHLQHSNPFRQELRLPCGAGKGKCVRLLSPMETTMDMACVFLPIQNQMIASLEHSFAQQYLSWILSGTLMTLKKESMFVSPKYF